MPPVIHGSPYDTGKPNPAGVQRPKTLAEVIRLVSDTIAARRKRLGEAASAKDATLAELDGAMTSLVKLAVARNDREAMALVSERNLTDAGQDAALAKLRAMRSGSPRSSVPAIRSKRVGLR
jgi:hypothetical protein